MADQIVCDTCAGAIGREEEWWHLRVLSFRGTDRSQPVAFFKANLCRRCRDELTLAEVGYIVSGAFEDMLRPHGAHGRARASRERRA